MEEEKEKVEELADEAFMPDLELCLHANTIGQAVFFESVILPELRVVIDRYRRDLVDLARNGINISYLKQ